MVFVQGFLGCVWRILKPSSGLLAGRCHYLSACAAHDARKDEQLKGSSGSHIRRFDGNSYSPKAAYMLG